MAIETMAEIQTDAIRLLIVDDEMAMLCLLSHECRLRFGRSAEVHTCHESREAIRLCSSLAINV